LFRINLDQQDQNKDDQHFQEYLHRVENQNV